MSDLRLYSVVNTFSRSALPVGPGGIFSGINSYPEPDDVMADLGDQFLTAFATSIAEAREDIDAMRAVFPHWFPPMHSRCLSNLIHDRIWARLLARLDGDPSVVMVDNGPRREIFINSRYQLRIKRHHAGDRISNYPTQGALNFWEQDGGQPPFDGMELIKLGIGYRWNQELRQIEMPILSFRDGKENVIWAVEIEEPAEGATTVDRNPVPGPDTPIIGIDGLGDDESEAPSDR